MKRVALTDIESTGLDAKKDALIEVGIVIWNIEHRAIEECFSGLLPAPANDAEAINGIPAGLLVDAPTKRTLDRVAEMVGRSDAIVAHNAAFDREWVPGLSEMDWICSIEDMEWPKGQGSKALSNLALAHGVAVVSAHRAIHDALLMARLFEAVPDIAERLEAGLLRCRRPKGEVISLAPFDQKDEAKAHGFHWDPARKVWHRTMALEDAAALPFRTRVR